MRRKTSAPCSSQIWFNPRQPPLASRVLYVSHSSQACRCGGQRNKVISVLEMMVEDGIPPSGKSYSSALQVCTNTTISHVSCRSFCAVKRRTDEGCNRRHPLPLLPSQPASRALIIRSPTHILRRPVSEDVPLELFTLLWRPPSERLLHTSTTNVCQRRSPLFTFGVIAKTTVDLGTYVEDTSYSPH